MNDERANAMPGLFSKKSKPVSYGTFNTLPSREERLWLKETERKYLQATLTADNDLLTKLIQEEKRRFPPLTAAQLTSIELQISNARKHLDILSRRNIDSDLDLLELMLQQGALHDLLRCKERDSTEHNILLEQIRDLKLTINSNQHRIDTLTQEIQKLHEYIDVAASYQTVDHDAQTTRNFSG